MKKGFTLIELLTVIIIIGVVALIAVPVVYRNIIESREKLYDIQVQDITLAGQKWAVDHLSELDTEFLNDTMVPLDMLKDLGYLPKEKIKDPTGKKEVLNGCVRVLYDIENKIYKYSYEEEENACKTGYYYEYDTTNSTWNKNMSNQKISIATYLIGENGANIVADGAGLYDMEDRYVFRGGVVSNNFVKIGNSSILYRILSIDKKTKSLKVVRSSGNSAVWDSSGNVDFNTATIHTENLNNKTDYSSIINSNMKWNSGVIEVVDNLNVDAARTYEKRTPITMEVGLITMSEYMESSLDSSCNSGVLEACSNDNYLQIQDGWTMTTTSNAVYYVDSSMHLSLESDLQNAHHNIYDTIYIKSFEKRGDGTLTSPFLISIG